MAVLYLGHQRNRNLSPYLRQNRNTSQPHTLLKRHFGLNNLSAKYSRPLQSRSHFIVTHNLPLHLPKDGSYHARMKHIDIRYHFIQYIIKEGLIQLVYCPTEDMTANTLTKALPSIKAKHFATALGLRLTWRGSVRILSMSQGRGSAVPWPKTWLWLDHSGMTLWPVVLDTQVPWSLHMVHYCIYYYLALILLYTMNNQSHSINTVVCGLWISSYSLTLNLHYMCSLWRLLFSMGRLMVNCALDGTKVI